MLKNDSSVDLLTVLFNKCYCSGLVPTIWNKAYIKPVPKSQTLDSRIPTNYRGISLLSCIGKLYSSVINRRLLQYLEDHKMLAEEQNGFRSKRACVDHIHSLTTIIRNRKIKNKDTFVCFIDMCKAFDHLDRQLLFNKLSSNINIGRNMFSAICGLYNNTTCRILLNEYCTDYFDILCGVKQGDTLSTTLFAIYINGLVEKIKNLSCGVDIAGYNVSILLYADDIALVAESEENLQAMLDCVNAWSEEWLMTINETKTKVVHFRKASKARTSTTFTCGNKNISLIDSYKYLGCTLTETLDYTKTSKVLSDAGSRALGATITRLKHNKGLFYKTYTSLYDKCVCTVSDYSSGVWGYKDYNPPNNLHHRAIRAFLGVHPFASLAAINGDMGWIPPIVRRKLNMIRLWHRFKNMDTQRLNYKIYQIQ